MSKLPETFTPAETATKPAPDEIKAVHHQQQRTRQDEAVLHGGESFRVSFRGDSPAEDVLVRLLPVRQYVDFISAQEDETKVIELVCDRPPGWAEKLTPSWHSILIESCFALNFSWAIAWSIRQQAMADYLGAGVLPPTARPSQNSVPAAATS